VLGAYAGQGDYVNNWEMRKRSVTLKRVPSRKELKADKSFSSLK